MCLVIRRWINKLWALMDSYSAGSKATSHQHDCMSILCSSALGSRSVAALGTKTGVDYESPTVNFRQGQKQA